MDNRADDALIDVRARLPVPSWPVWQAHEKPPAVLVQTAMVSQSTVPTTHSTMSEHDMDSKSAMSTRSTMILHASPCAVHRNNGSTELATAIVSYASIENAPSLRE